MNEIFFLVEEALERGYAAKAKRLSQYNILFIKRHASL